MKINPEAGLEAVKMNAEEEEEEFFHHCTEPPREARAYPVG